MTFLLNNDMRYEKIISIGFFCSGAIGLEKIGYRDRSYPFDWVISDIYSITSLLQNDFQDLFVEELLYRNPQNPYIVVHRKYKFDFYHDFQEGLSIGSQLKSVENKYRKRIANFYSSISKPTLFIRYLMDDELPFWYGKENNLVKFVKEFNQKNGVLLIANRGLSIDYEQLVPGVVRFFEVDPDENDSVARNFIEGKGQVRHFLKNIHYPFQQLISNYSFYYRKKIINKINNLHGKLDLKKLN